MTGERDGLVRYETAAELLGIQPRSFHTWADRRGIRPVRVVRLGRANIALYSANEILAGRPTNRSEGNQP